MDEMLDFEASDDTSALPDSPALEDSDIDTEDQKRDVGYEIHEDIENLRAAFPELQDLRDITELSNPTRYAALRDLGLSASEAYLATMPRPVRPDNRAHLTSSVPRGAKSPDGPMTKGQLSQARALFGDMSDSEIYNLYKKVTK